MPGGHHTAIEGDVDRGVGGDRGDIHRCAGLDQRTTRGVRINIVSNGAGGGGGVLCVALATAGVQAYVHRQVRGQAGATLDLDVVAGADSLRVNHTGKTGAAAEVQGSPPVDIAADAAADGGAAGTDDHLHADLAD